ncbi:hypothetical protein EJ04DRAFT_442765, partial [Polyplosphaeria fusca]
EESFNSQWTLHPLSTRPSQTTLTPDDQRDTTETTSLRSFETYDSSTSTATSIDKIKNGWNRLRRKPVPRYMLGSIRRHPAAEIEPTRIGRGVWKDQLLVDRSIRFMAVLTTLFAIAMFIVMAVNLPEFYRRTNKFTSSVGGESRNCKEVTHENTALLLLVNVAATMVLGMSNTYQQLVTSLKIGDLQHMLKKFGDSRVGTNSPFSINHKESGKKSSWAAWLLLICTSIPVHFLANSLLGPSYVLQPPMTVQYNESSWLDIDDFNWDRGEDYLASRGSFVCWSAFRTGQAHFPKSLDVLREDDESAYGAGLNTFGTQYSKLVVQFARENCTDFRNTTNDLDRLESSHHWTSTGYMIFEEGDCRMGTAVYCSLYGTKEAQCRLNVRMNAVFVLAACLVAKALYMIAVNLCARGKLKRHLLTFGDVIVASASNPELRLQGYVPCLDLTQPFAAKIDHVIVNVWSTLAIPIGDRHLIRAISIAKPRRNQRRAVRQWSAKIDSYRILTMPR